MFGKRVGELVEWLVGVGVNVTEVEGEVNVLEESENQSLDFRVDDGGGCELDDVQGGLTVGDDVYVVVGVGEGTRKCVDDGPKDRGELDGGGGCVGDALCPTSRVTQEVRKVAVEVVVMVLVD